MAFSTKTVAFCVCLLLAVLGVSVHAGQGMMGGLLGGGGKHGGGYGGIETLLVAGLLAKLLSNSGNGFGGARSAQPVQYAQQPMQYRYGYNPQAYGYY